MMRSVALLLCLALSSSGAGALSVAASKGPGSDQVVGHFKGMLDGYLQKYEDEEARFARVDESMQGVVQAAHNQQTKLSAIDERLRLKKQHEKELAGIAAFVKTLNQSILAMKPYQKDWLAKYPETDAKVKRILAAHPVFF